MTEPYTMHQLHDTSESHEPSAPQELQQFPAAAEVHDLPNASSLPFEPPASDFLAEAYVFPQPLTEIYPPEIGLRHGTAFPNLYKPYDPQNPRRGRA